MKKLLILENHPISLTGLTTLLREELKQVEVIDAIDLEKALDILNSTNIDVLFLSANYEQENLSLIENIKNSTSIVLYYRDFKTALDVKKKYTQVQGLLSQLATSTELLKCIEAVSLNQSYFCEATLRYTLEYLLKSENDGAKKVNRTSTGSESTTSLSRREKQIHGLIVEGKGTSEIATHLNLKMSTISTVKHKILKKMNVNNVVELLKKSNTGAQEL